MTKKYKTWATIFLLMSVLLNIGPMAAYVITAFFSATLITEKVALTMTIFIVVIMTAVSLINKTTMKSRLWVILIGLYLCLDNFITPLIIIGICQIVDEWIASPLRKRYHNLYTINREIDKRGV